MSNYSYEIEKLSRNLEQFLKEPKLYPFDEIENSIDQHFFEDNFIRQNLALNLLWIFSKQRILTNNMRIQAICSWLYQNIKPRLHLEHLYPLVSAYTIVAIEKLTAELNELPSIRSCLTNVERQSVKDKLLELKIDDRVLEFKSSSQYIQLSKLKTIPIVNSFLEHYDELLELATGDDGDASLDQVLQYILTINDVIPDGKGVLGLVDDLYALEQLKIKSSSLDLFNLKWRFEMEFPDFQYPIIIDQSGNNLVNRADDFIKAALYYSEELNLKFKTFFMDEPGPFSMLSSILGSISDLKLDKQSTNISNVSRLIQGDKYMFANGPETICVEFSEVLTYGDQKLYMFQTLGNKIKIPRSLINKCQLIFGGPELSLEKKVVKFIEESSYTIHGMFPFGLANNLDVNFERVFIVDRKNKIDKYLETKIEGKNIKEWFGINSINTKLEEDLSFGLLSNQPLINVTYSLKSLIRYLSQKTFTNGEFHSLNIILDTNIENNIEDLNYLSTAYHHPFKTINIYTNQKGSFVQKIYKDLGYSIFEEKRSLNQKFIHPPRDSLFENYLSKIGSYPEINFIRYQSPELDELLQLLNIKIDSENVKLKRYLYQIRTKLLSRYSQLTKNGKIDFIEDLETYVNKLVSYKHIHENISHIIDFVNEHKDFLRDFEKFNFVMDAGLNTENEKILVTDKELARLKKKGWQENHISMLEIKEINQLKHLIVPATTSIKNVKNLIYFPYAEKITFVASSLEIENFLKPLVDKRDLIKQDKTIDIENVLSTETEFEEHFLKLDYDFGSLKQSSNSEKPYGARVFIFETNEYLALPLKGRTIITRELRNFHPEELMVENIEEATFLIRPITNHGDLQDSILDKTISNIEEIRSMAFLWKSKLSEAFKSGERSIEELFNFLKIQNQSKHIFTIKNWFKSPTLIAPDKPDVIFPLFSQFLNLQDDYFDECHAAVNALYKARNQVLKNLPQYLQNADFDDDKNLLTFNFENKSFEANVYEVLTYQDTEVSFENLYKVRDLEDYD